MKIRFQADADLKESIVSAIIRHEPAIDFQTAKAAGLYGLLDDKVLAIAAQEGRVLVSHDRRTMPRHFADFIATTISPGLLIIAQNFPFAAAVEELYLIWAIMEAEQWINQIASLPLPRHF